MALLSRLIQQLFDFRVDAFAWMTAMAVARGQEGASFVGR